MKARLISLVAVLSILTAAFYAPPVQAAKGTPNSPDFGYGARIDLAGDYIPEAFQSAARRKMDWVAIDFDWSTRWPEADTQPSLQDLDKAMLTAQKYGLSVLLSLKNTPGWAITANGPDPALTSWLVVSLAQRYPDSLQAIELFPGANTVVGWGSDPNPVAYASLYQIALSSIQNANLSILLVAAGLTPIPADEAESDIDDLRFLQGLYDAGAAGMMPVISIAMPALTGSPLQSPDGSEHRILRHYEEARQVMLANNHPHGILWITHFSWPSGRIQFGDTSYYQTENQTVWLSQAYRMLRAQLYIGAAFYSALNPSESTGSTSLIRSDTSHHPFFDMLGKLIAQNNQNLDAANEFKEPQIKNIIKTRS